MKRPLLVISLVANALLLVATVRRPSAPSSTGSGVPPPAAESGSATAKRSSSAGAAEPAPVAPLEWSSLNVGDWFAYREGLLAAGCPPATVREILEPLVDRAFRTRQQAILAPHIQQFWELFRPPSSERTKELEAVLEALKDERAQVIEKLLRGLPTRGEAPATPADAEEAFSFLPPELRDRALDAWDRFGAREQEFNRDFQGSGPERAAALKKLREETEAELAEFLSPEQLAELRLRQSPASRLRMLEGVALSPAELAAVVGLRDRLAAGPGGPARAAAERAELEKLLGPPKAAEILRAENPQFQTLLRVADRLGATEAQAVRLWEARRLAAESAAAVLADASVARAEKLPRLEALRREIGGQAATILGGGRGRATWELAERDWLNSVFTPPPEDPLADPAPQPLVK